MSSPRAVASVSQGCVVYANNGTHSRPALALLEMDVCVVGGFSLALLLLAMTRTLISIDQPPALVAMQAGFSSCIAAKVCFTRTCVSSAWSHGASTGTRNTLVLMGGYTPSPQTPTPSLSIIHEALHIGLFSVM